MKAHNNQYYVALSLKVEKNNQTHFKKEIQNQLNQSMKDLISCGEVKDILVYSHKKTAKKHGEFELWDYLILIKINKKEDAPKVLPALKTIPLPYMPETIRLELMVTTPESTYPLPSEGVKKRLLKPFHVVEYVDVEEPYLKEFQQIMIRNNGPAMKYIMENAKWCYNFYALETVTVFFHNPRFPKWNQIHVIGLYVESMLLFKKHFEKALQHVSQASYEENFGRLKQIRTMLFKTIGSKVASFPNKNN